jgi:UDP-N-acetyl-D-glucosamine dehydrogenase
MAKSNSQTNKLLDNIANHRATVGVVGLGYVGLPLVLEFHKRGFNVIGYDVDESKCRAIRKGKTYIKHIPDERIRTLRSKSFSATTDFSRIPESDAILLCVPTPLTEHREPDMTYIEATAQSIGPYLRKGQLVVLESTTYPGTTVEVLKPILEGLSKLKAGKDFYLAYSPEREDPNNPEFSTATIPKVVGGHTPDCLKVADALYKEVICETVPVSSTQAAEATKLMENIFRCINIALVNELKVVFSSMDIDVWEVVEAASTKPFGFMPFYPGPGLGGHCIPIDPFYLTWKAREYDVATRFIELAGEINTRMPHYVVQRVMEELNDKKRSLNGSKILILGMAYKKNVDDVRESPSFSLWELLEEKGAKVSYHDPHVPEILPMREHVHLLGKKSVPLTPKQLARFDCVLISTAHDGVDYAMVCRHSDLVIDTRNATAKLKRLPKSVKKA